MRRLDSLYRKEINHEQIQVQPEPILVNSQPKKKISFNMFYFYRSLRVVMGIWIFLLCAIIVYPWVDYYIKKKINKPQQVLGVQTLPSSSFTPIAVKPTIAAETTPTFNLKKGELEINTPIVNGISDEDLKKGIGHHQDSVWPNQKGNVVLAGHSFSLDADNPYSEVFSRLRELEIGDQVTINYLGKKYIYKIFKREKVSPQDISLFGKTDNWQLTFYTCDPPKTDWYRLVFQAELIEIK